MADPDIRQHDGQTSPDAGPDHPPPSLPAGWTAQWDGRFASLSVFSCAYHHLQVVLLTALFDYFGRFV